jgi:hypothetical protein
MVVTNNLLYFAAIPPVHGSRDYVAPRYQTLATVLWACQGFVGPEQCAQTHTCYLSNPKRVDESEGDNGANLNSSDQEPDLLLHSTIGQTQTTG